MKKLLAVMFVALLMVVCGEDTKNGIQTEYWENGQQDSEGNYKGGKLMTVVVWKPNDDKCPRTNVDEDGNGVVVDYRVDGTEYRSRRSIRNGIFRSY